MSRLPLPDKPASTPIPTELVLMIEQSDDAPISSTQITSWTKTGPVLSKVLQYILLGWPNKVDNDITPYWNRRLELSAHAGCVLWGIRVIVPPQGRCAILSEQHSGHPGITRMKALARHLVWWPKLEKDVKDVVKHCNDCQQNRATPPPGPLHPWQWPTCPWTRLHIDFAGLIEGNMLLIVVDSHLKWIEAFAMENATSAVTLLYLRQVFAQFGIPEAVVSDNGTQFVSDEFKNFVD